MSRREHSKQSSRPRPLVVEQRLSEQQEGDPLRAAHLPEEGYRSGTQSSLPAASHIHGSPEEASPPPDLQRRRKARSGQKEVVRQTATMGLAGRSARRQGGESQETSRSADGGAVIRNCSRYTVGSDIHHVLEARDKAVGQWLLIPVVGAVR